MPGQPPISDLSKIPPRDNKKIIILGGIVIIFLVVVIMGYFVAVKLLDTIPYDQINIENGTMIEDDLNNEPVVQGEENITEPEIVEPVEQLIEEDNDGDGLTNAEERALGTNLNVMDSDGDGLFDEEEVNKYKTDPLSVDTDGDGILDGTEVRSGNDPNGPGKLFNIPGGEISATTQIPQTNIDTDGDGLIDNEENQIGTNIVKTDSDLDKLTDYEEVKIYGTDPLNPDTDGDGYLDGAEVENGYNPNGSGALNQ